MKKRLLRLTNALLLPMLFLLLMAVSWSGKAQTNDCAGGPTLTIDKLDYSPGEQVKIKGTCWQPNEEITLQVDHLSTPIPDHGTPDPHESWTTHADGTGNFSAAWYVSEYEIGAELLLTADGAISGLTLEIFFTDKAKTTVTLSSDINHSSYGESITFTASLPKSGSKYPSGTISFRDNGVEIGTGTLSNVGSNSVATFATSNLSAATHPITAYYGGDNSFEASDLSSAVNQVVNKKTLTIAATSKTKTYGDLITFNMTSPSDDFTVTGLTNSDAVASVTLASDGAAATAAYSATPYAITVSAAVGTGLDNYQISYTPSTLTVNKKTLTIAATSKTKTYGDLITFNMTSPSDDFTVTGLTNSDAVASVTLASDGAAATAAYSATPYAITVSAAVGTGLDNYQISYTPSTLTVNKRAISISANAGQFKYCGQDDPTFKYTPSETLIIGNNFSGNLEREAGVGVGTYAYKKGTLSAGSNYTLELVGSNTFEIKGIFVDASASSKAVKLNTAPNTTILSVTVTNSENVPIPNASVVFTVAGKDYFATTNQYGTATYSISTSSLTLGVYAVKAIVGAGCAEDAYGYLTMYDPNTDFVTGGGWIMSPENAYVADPSLTGKANFGFVSKYKKGSNQVDGNTEFQFKAGDFNFKSSLHDAGTLVISGAKATYRGVGTVNGAGNYGFMIVAFDGDINTADNVANDLFRIKIWDKNNGNATVYDNEIGKLENTDDATELGGGSIVIHSDKKKSAFIEPEVVVVEPIVKAYPNPFTERLNIEFSSVNDTQAILEIYSITSAKLETLFNGPVEGGVLYKVEYVPNLVSSQMVLYKLTMDGKTQVGKMMYNERR